MKATICTYRHPTLREDCIRVRLSEKDMERGRIAGLARNKAQRDSGKPDPGVKADKLGADIQGAQAELAASLGLGLTWMLPIERNIQAWAEWIKNGTDLSKGVEVKSIDLVSKGLLIQVGERYQDHHKYVLVDATPAPVFRILGWNYGYEVRQDKNFKDEDTVPSVPKPCYILSQDYLRPIKTLYDGFQMPLNEADDAAAYLEGYYAAE